MKNFCLDLREHATKIINYEKKEMIPITKKDLKKDVKKDLVPTIAIQNIIRLEIIVTMLGNIEVLLMISAT